jgi:porin
MANIINKVVCGAAALALAATALSFGPARAETFAQFLQQPTMTGNWGGVRTSLAQEGISFSGQYIGQFGANPIGGKQQGNAYNQQIIVGADWDLSKLIGLPGGVLHTDVIDRAGSSLQNYVGGVINQYGTFGAGQNLRLLKFDYEQNYLGSRVNTIIGYFPMGLEFAHSGYLCNAGFLNNSFCSHPQFLGGDSGYNLGPVATWGGRIKIFPIPNLYIETGATEVNPQLSADTDKGFDLNFDGATGAIIPLEFGLTTKFGPDGLVGHYQVGGIYDTSTVKDVVTPSVLRDGRYLGYILVDQEVWQIAPGATQGLTGYPRGLVLFGKAGMGDKRTAAEDTFLAAGLVFQGPFASRPADDIFFGWAQAHINTRILKHDDAVLLNEGLDFTTLPAEDDFELGYAIQVARWMQVNPDVQYVIDPDAGKLSHYPNAWLFGFQATVNF